MRAIGEWQSGSGVRGYNLSRTVEVIRPAYRFDVSCQGSGPEAPIAFLDSTGHEAAVRLAKNRAERLFLEKRLSELRQ